MYKIEKGIELPGKCTGTKRKEWSYPWDKMEVGDSFFIKAASKIKAQKTRTNIYYTLRLYNQSTSNSLSIATRVFDTDDERGLRVWRTA